MKTLNFLRILAACLLAASFLTGAARAAEPKPVLTLSISSYLNVLEAGKAIANQVGQGDAYGMVQAFFGTLPGTDNTKPLGFVLFATDEEFLPVIFLPVNDLDRLSGLFPMINTFIYENMEEIGPGKYLFSGPMELILEQKKDWLILYPESYPKFSVDDPSVFLNGLDKKYLLAFHVNFENTPKELVFTLISGVEMMMSLFNPDAAEQLATAKKAVELLLDEGKWMLMGLDIDTTSGDITSEYEVEIKPTGTFAEMARYVKGGKTNFIGFHRPEQAAAFVGVGVMADFQKESQINQMKNFFANAIEGVEYELEDDEFELVKGILESLEEIVVATIEDGKSDMAMSWKTTGEIFFASRVAKGNLLGDALKKAVAGISEATPELKDLFKIEYTTFEGYKFSSLAVPFALVNAFTPDMVELPEHLEDASINLLIGVKDDAVCGVIGTDISTLEPILKRCITDSKTSANLPQPVITFSLPRAARAIESLGLLPPEPLVVAVLDSLKAAPEDATITADSEITTNSQGVKNIVKINFSGKIIAAIAKAVAAGHDAQMQMDLNFDPFEEAPRSRERARDFNFQEK